MGQGNYFMRQQKGPYAVPSAFARSGYKGQGTAAGNGTQHTLS